MDRGECGIYCNSDTGPIFGNAYYSHLSIDDHCNQDNKCSMNSSFCSKVKTPSESEVSFFVDMEESDDEMCSITVLDYEVFSQCK